MTFTVQKSRPQAVHYPDPDMRTIGVLTISPRMREARVNGMPTFFKITLPNIKWGLIYGIILCNARAMGEFGSVYVVSGRIRGETNTMPLHIEVLYNDYQFTASFAVASLLAMLALVTLIVKSIVEWKIARDLRVASQSIES